MDQSSGQNPSSLQEYVPMRSTSSFSTEEMDQLVAPTCGVDVKRSAEIAEEQARKKINEQMNYVWKMYHAADQFCPFKLNWVYGRMDTTSVFSLTGLYRNSILYSSSNVVVLLDFIENKQKCLQAHRKTITSLAMEPRMRFFATGSLAKESIIVVWDTLKAKPVKIFEKVHLGSGTATLAFTGRGYTLASIGNEEAGKQTICFWDFEPKPDNKGPNYTKSLPEKTPHVREICFCHDRTEFFTLTGDHTVMCCTRLEQEEDQVFIHKPDLRSTLISKQKKFVTSMWLRASNGEWLVTATSAGFVLVWGIPSAYGLETPPDKNKNIKELKKFYKISEEGVTFLNSTDQFIVAGDELGIIRFFDNEFKIIRYTGLQYTNLPPICSVSFNLRDPPEFKQMKFTDNEPPSFYKSSPAQQKEGVSCIKDYTKGGVKNYPLLDQMTIEKFIFQCPDFIIGTRGGNVYYHHTLEDKVDLIVQGSPAPFIACDRCLGSDHLLFCTRAGDLVVYNRNTHKPLFSDKVFTRKNKINCMKCHPMGQFVVFGMTDGRLCFRVTCTWTTFIPPMSLGKDCVEKIIFTSDGVFMCYCDKAQNMFLLRYSPKVKKWYIKTRLRPHRGKILDVQFVPSSESATNRLFSMGSDRRLIEYDMRATDDTETGVKIMQISYLEQCYQPSAFVFDNPLENVDKCFTFANELNKLRLYDLEKNYAVKTCHGPVFGRHPPITKLYNFPCKTNGKSKKFLLYVVNNKLGIINPPIDGNPHRYMGILTHPEAITEAITYPTLQSVVTIGKDDSAGFEWNIDMRSVEGMIVLGGKGSQPFYFNIRRQWGAMCKDIVKDIKLIFFYLNIKRIERQEDIFSIKNTIRLIEVPAVCRALGFFPSEFEVDVMLEELRQDKVAEKSYTNDFKTEVDLDDFIRFFGNQYYRTTNEDIKNALRAIELNIGRFDARPYYHNETLIKYLMTEGEPFKVHEYPVCLRALYGEQENIEELEDYFMDLAEASHDYEGAGAPEKESAQGSNETTSDSDKEEEEEEFSELEDAESVHSLFTDDATEEDDDSYSPEPTEQMSIDDTMRTESEWSAATVSSAKQSKQKFVTPQSTQESSASSSKGKSSDKSGGTSTDVSEGEPST